ncbi:MAG: hypothetical protein N5P05_001022 [Chroococcopsis gigantea SAG 12.99]|jgi:lipopolysaccharide export system permease protein|nr:LptF/LptG family permease [Chlorogloea purpurea SAG 13.99]MDV2999416.1 hypothetical protein [Chroococcopsis gigantea SAG 12.99]
MSVIKLVKSRYKEWKVGKYGLSLLDRYIIGQILPSFLFSVGLFASLGVAVGNLSDLANKIIDSNLPIREALEILLLKVPEFVSYALPVSILLSTLLTYGRFSSDSETIAFRSCGISLYRLVIPALVMSLIVTGITFLFNELVVPAANFRATAILVKSIKAEQNFWQNKDIFYPNYEINTLADGSTERILKSLFYAKEFDGKEMKSLTILTWLKQELREIVISDSASWNPEKNNWDFFNGTQYLLTLPDSSYERTIPFKHKTFSLPKEVFEFASQARDPYEMNIIQASQYLHLLQLGGDEKKVRMFQVRIQQKISFPFVCLIFGLIGATFGSLPQQMGRGTSFGFCVSIVFLYYLLSFLIGSLGLIGVLTPVLAAWIPNLMGLSLGAWLLWRFNG